MDKALEQSIKNTLAYFDLFDFPLTKEELFRFLWESPRIGYEEFVNFLSLRGGAPSAVEERRRSNPPDLTPASTGEIASSLPASRRVVPRNDRVGIGEIAMTKFGYYFIPGRSEIVEIRRRAIIPTELKLKKARRAAKFIRSVPFLRAIFVCNSVGMETARPESDIDFFIVAEKNRIWLVRFFSNLILRLFGLRTYGSFGRDKICLSFFVDAAHLDLSPLRIADDDIHFACWLHQMLPIYDPENYYEKFVEANGWTERFLPNMASANHPMSPSLERRGGVVSPPARGGVALAGRGGGRHRLGRGWKKMWEAMWRGAYGDLLEKQAKGFQWAKMKLSVKEKSELGDKGVVIGEGVIKLHENDTRKGIRERWMNSIKCLISNS